MKRRAAITTSARLPAAPEYDYKVRVYLASRSRGEPIHYALFPMSRRGAFIRQKQKKILAIAFDTSMSASSGSDAIKALGRSRENEDGFLNTMEACRAIALIDDAVVARSPGAIKTVSLRHITLQWGTRASIRSLLPPFGNTEI